MAHEPAHDKRQFELPSSVAGPTDVTRLQRESEGLDEYLRQTDLRKEGQAVALPKIPIMLHDIAMVNRLNLLHTGDRQKLTDFLNLLQTQAPVVHVSFAAEPSTEFTGKIIAWLRQNIHPYVLVQIGLQPSIAAGCTIRTTNKVFDFSLRQHFVRNRQLLIDAIIKLGEQPAPAAQQPQPTVPLPAPVAPLPAGEQKA